MSDDRGCWKWHILFKYAITEHQSWPSLHFPQQALSKSTSSGCSWELHKERIYNYNLVKLRDASLQNMKQVSLKLSEPLINPF